MDQKNHIKMLAHKGLSQVRIAKETGHDRKTIRQVIRSSSSVKPPYILSRNTKGKLYRERIEILLSQNASATTRKNHLTARRIFDLLCEENGVLSVGRRCIERIVREVREDLRIQRKERFLELEHHPGEAQLDFGEIGVFLKETPVRLPILVITLPYSNARWAVVLPAQNFSCLAEGMRRLFEEMGGVPTRIRFDNMSTAVRLVVRKTSQTEMPVGVYDADNHPRVLTDDFCRLMAHYGFTAEFCGPSKGNEKGSVENAVGFIRRNVFVPAVKAASIDEINARILIPRCRKFLEDRHYKHSDQTISERFKDDRAEFMELPGTAFSSLTYRECTVNSYGRVIIDTNEYPVRCEPDSDVIAELSAESIVFRLQKNQRIVGRAERCYGRGKTFIDWETELEMLARKPMAFRNSSLSKLLKSDARDIIGAKNSAERKIILSAALGLLKNGTDIGEIVRRIDLLTARNGNLDADGFAGAIRFENEILPDDMPKMKGCFDSGNVQKIPSMSCYEIGGSNAVH